MATQFEEWRLILSVHGQACIKNAGYDSADPSTVVKAMRDIADLIESVCPILKPTADQSLVIRINGKVRAEVWGNGTWHTYNVRGIGGENGVETSVPVAQAEAIAAMLRQKIVGGRSRVVWVLKKCRKARVGP